MLHLAYRFRLTGSATADPAAFWSWLKDREKWFYDGLDTVLATQWRVCTIGRHVHTLEHVVTFADEAGWGQYRRQVAERDRDPAWQARRVSQDRWWRMEEAQIHTDPPIPLGLRQTSAAAVPPDDLIARSRHLVDHARYLTLATLGPDGVWAATVNYVPVREPLRLLYYSMTEARHSRNIVASPTISGALHLTGLAGFGIDGAQFIGVCRPTEPADLPGHYEHYYQHNFPDEATRRQWQLPVTEFVGTGPRRFYAITIDQWWLLDISRWLTDKVDRRTEVNPKHI